ncbi:MAG: helix-turn-helix transcriptional regulator [Paraclostridium sp.]
MDFIISVVEDFYECCNIPVKVMSNELEDIYSIGYNKYFEDLFPLSKIKDLIDNCNDYINMDFKLDDSNIYYRIVRVSKFNNTKGFFILGPISIKVSNNKNIYNIPYRSLDCINYMCKFILNIADDKFAHTMDNKCFNPYIRKAIEYVHTYYHSDISISSICSELDINKSYFCSLFKKCTGNTFSYFLNHFRVEKSKYLLKNTNLNLLDIAISVGFNNQNYYSMVFRKYTNQTPSEYRISN